MDPINPIAGNPQALKQFPPSKKQPGNGFMIGAMAVFILLCLGVVVFTYYQNQQLKGMLASYQLQPSSTPKGTTNSITNWQTYDFSSSISFKIPPSVNKPKYVNAGQYAVQTALPGGTFLQVWGADGASPTAGKDIYDDIVKSITSNSSLKSNKTIIDNNEVLNFSGEGLDFKTGIIWGGETVAKLKGLIIKMYDGRALVVVHYEDQTQQENVDFDSDEKIFDQIFSSLQFLNPSASASAAATSNNK